MQPTTRIPVTQPPLLPCSVVGHSGEDGGGDLQQTPQHVVPVRGRQLEHGVATQAGHQDPAQGHLVQATLAARTAHCVVCVCMCVREGEREQSEVTTSIHTVLAGGKAGPVEV